MALEMDAIRSLQTGERRRRLGGVEFHEGKLQGRPVVTAVCGVGKVNAALCAQTMLLQFQPELVLNMGVAGGLLPEMQVGDIAVASAVVQHDMDTTALGEPRGYLSNLRRVELPCDATAVARLLAAAKSLEGVRAHRGVIATGDQFVHRQAVKEKLAREFKAIACEMEGGAIGQVCALQGVPFCVVRAISDGANDEAPVDFVTFARQAAERTAALVNKYFSLSSL
jgi:adenosylhomocysteine nucleosidase